MYIVKVLSWVLEFVVHLMFAMLSLELCFSVE